MEGQKNRKKRKKRRLGNLAGPVRRSERGPREEIIEMGTRPSELGGLGFEFSTPCTPVGRRRILSKAPRGGGHRRPQEFGLLWISLQANAEVVSNK